MCQTHTTTIYVIKHVVQVSCAKQPRKVPATWWLWLGIFKPDFHTLLKIDSLRFSDSKSETQSDVSCWNKLSTSTLSFLLRLPCTMMIASYLSQCYSPLWACLPDCNKGQGSYRYYLSIHYIIPVSVTEAHRKLITDGHKHYECTSRQSRGHGDH